jgi:peroxiredoxin
LAHLDFLTRALVGSGRTDAVTSILAVLAPDQVAKVRPTDGIAFADDDRGWAHLLGVKKRPATAVISLSGEVVWRHEGELTSADLATALKKHLVAGGRFTSRLLQLNVRTGQPAPNFLFEFAPGREMTLRKLVGRPVVLVFWKSSSQPSLETLRQLQTMSKARGQGPTLLAINDGEPPELAKKIAAEGGLSAIVVTDPEREISFAYGVNLWPTTIVIDAGGLVRDIRYGRFSREQVKYAAPARTAGA